MWPYLGPVRAYGPIYSAGLAAHFVIASLLARRFRLKRPIPTIIRMSYVLGMSVGAKALFDVQDGTFSFVNLFSARHWMEGGLWGGPLAYLCLAVPLVLALSREWRAGVDLVALAAPIPMAIAKVACLCNGCCYGKPTRLPWAITCPVGPGPAPAGVPLHPTQIYEILVLVVTAIILYRVNNDRWRGTLLFWFLAVYAIGRPLTELFRGDLADQPLWGPLTRAQCLCGAASAVSMCILLLHHRRAARQSPAGVPTQQPASIGNTVADSSSLHRVPLEEVSDQIVH